MAPTNKVYAVVERNLEDGAGTVRDVRAVRWGLLPAWWKPGLDPRTNKQKTMPTLHNARADKLASAPSWRSPFAKRQARGVQIGRAKWHGFLGEWTRGGIDDVPVSQDALTDDEVYS